MFLKEFESPLFIMCAHSNFALQAAALQTKAKSDSKI